MFEPYKPKEYRYDVDVPVEPEPDWQKLWRVVVVNVRNRANL